jgi:F-type H+-transporting ATPase subunit a
MEHDVVQAAHSAATHTKEAEELPNFITALHDIFPASKTFTFFHHWENIVFSLLVLGFIAWRFLIAAQKKEFLPKGVQNRWELFAEGIASFVTGILGPRGMEHVPYLGTLFIYILLENWLGMIPLMKSPTSSWSTTIALALITTAYVQWVGIKSQGFLHYMKHIAGNPQGLLGLALVPLMVVINLSIEFLAVPLSLSLRLFANISSEDKLLFKFAELNAMYYFLPFVFQLFANVLVIIFSLVQAFVFFLLSTVYISLISPGEGHGSGAHGDGPVSNH